MSKPCSISVIIPTRNEAGGIEKIITSVRPFCDEVIVADGNSTDGTQEISKKCGALVFQDDGTGKGAGYRVGIANASCDIIVFIDADGSHEATDIPNLARPIIENKADLIIASRFRGGSDEWEGDLETYIRHLGSGILTIGINMRFGTKLTDCLNGFRALRTSAAQSFPLLTSNFDVEQHMICQFLKHGYRVDEVSSHEYCRGWGESKLPTYTKAYLFFWRLFLDLAITKKT